ncbi:hypothetical protein EsH8_VII_000230 [Colletotrichum jinshuiense]
MQRHTEHDAAVIQQTAFLIRTSLPNESVASSADPARMGGPIFSRVSRVKTATVTFTAIEATPTPTLASLTASLPSTTSTTFTTLTLPTAMQTASSTQETALLPTSSNSTSEAPHVSIPLNTLIAIIAGTVGGFVVLLFVIGIIRACVRRKRAIYDEAHSTGGIPEKACRGERHDENSANDSTLQHPLSTAPWPDMTHLSSEPSVSSTADFRCLPVLYDTHPRRIIAELPAEPYFGHARHGFTG